MAISPSKVNSFSYGKNDPISHVLIMAHMMLFIDVYCWFKSSGVYVYSDGQSLRTYFGKNLNILPSATF